MKRVFCLNLPAPNLKFRRICQKMRQNLHEHGYLFAHNKYGLANRTSWLIDWIKRLTEPLRTKIRLHGHYLKPS
jgi:hypothetical protein